MESSRLRDNTIKGGDGFAEATIGDMGFTKTNGVVGSGLSETSVLEQPVRKNVKRKRKKEVLCSHLQILKQILDL